MFSITPFCSSSTEHIAVSLGLLLFSRLSLICFRSSVFVSLFRMQLYTFMLRVARRYYIKLSPPLCWCWAKRHPKLICLGSTTTYSNHPMQYIIPQMVKFHFPVCFLDRNLKRSSLSEKLVTVSPINRCMRINFISSNSITFTAFQLFRSLSPSSACLLVLVESCQISYADWEIRATSNNEVNWPHLSFVFHWPLART